MNQFNLSNFLNKLINYSPLNPKGGRNPNLAGTAANADVKFQIQSENLTQNLLSKSMQQVRVFNTFSQTTFANLKMNNLTTLERGLYVKDLMNLPKEIEEILVIIQNKMAPAEELTQLLAKNIKLSELTQLMQQGSKEAMNKIIMAMSNASKQGITDLSQIKDTMKLINASVSVAGQDNPQQILKSFMLLYLPWLPLQEGVDFDLEIESSEGAEGESETSIIIMISTRNYGNVKITLVLFGTNSVNIIINCCEKFPKEELLKRINTEGTNHSMQTSVAFESTKTEQIEEKEFTRQAKITMSNMSEINPFLLLMANAVIRHTIELDNQIC